MYFIQLMLFIYFRKIMANIRSERFFECRLKALKVIGYSKTIKNFVNQGGVVNGFWHKWIFFMC